MAATGAAAGGSPARPGRGGRRPRPRRHHPRRRRAAAGLPYLVMQYVAGKSLQERLDRGGPLELAEILRIGMQAAVGLAAAHAQGLIHRDIKPANILLENGVERVKITDFGLARAVDDATHDAERRGGRHAAVHGPRAGPRRGGRPPHRPVQPGQRALRHVHRPGPVPRQHEHGRAQARLRGDAQADPRANPEIPDWLVTIIDRLHAKDPADRYGSAAEVADLLGRCLAHVQQPASVPLPAELLPVRNRRALAPFGASPGRLLAGGSAWFPGAREAAGQAASYVATVLRLKTPEGTLVVETDDPNIGIKLDGSELVVTGAGVKELRLSVGQHKRPGRQGRQDPPRRAGHDQPGRADGVDRATRGGKSATAPRLRPQSLARNGSGPGPAGNHNKAQGSPKRNLSWNRSAPRSAAFVSRPTDAISRLARSKGSSGSRAGDSSRRGGPNTDLQGPPRRGRGRRILVRRKELVSGGWDHHVKLWDIVTDRFRQNCSGTSRDSATGFARWRSAPVEI